MTGAVVRSVAELGGFGLILAFCFVLWPPLPLLAAGVLLVVWANLGDEQRPAAPVVQIRGRRRHRR